MNNSDPQPENTEETDADALRAETPSASDQTSVQGLTEVTGSFCSKHNTHPEGTDPCWQCVVECIPAYGDDLLKSLKEMRDVAAICFCVINRSGSLAIDDLSKQLATFGISEGFEKRADGVIAKVEGRKAPSDSSRPESEAVAGVAAAGESVPQKGEVVGQPSLSEVLDLIERDARWRYSNPVTAAEIADQVPVLVKALRRAMKFIRSDKGGCSPVLACNCENDITSILTSAGDKKEQDLGDTQSR